MNKRKQDEEADTSPRPPKLHKHKGAKNHMHEHKITQWDDTNGINRMEEKAKTGAILTDAKRSAKSTAQSFPGGEHPTHNELPENKDDNNTQYVNILAHAFPWYSLLEFEAQDETIAPTVSRHSSAPEIEAQYSTAAENILETPGGNDGSSNSLQTPENAGEADLAVASATVQLQQSGRCASTREEVMGGEGNATLSFSQLPISTSVDLSSLLHRPNSGTQSLRLLRERDEVIIQLHYKPLVNSNTFPYATSTGARKHQLVTSVSPHTFYTPEVPSVTSNTGAWKGGWSAGVHPDTSYAGDVTLFPVADCVQKGTWLDGIAIAECDTPREVVGVGTHIEFVLREVVAQPAPMSSPETPLLAQMIRHPRKAVKLPFTVLRTSDERTFTRSEPHSAAPSASAPSRPPSFDPQFHDPTP